MITTEPVLSSESRVTLSVIVFFWRDGNVFEMGDTGMCTARMITTEPVLSRESVCVLGFLVRWEQI